MVFTRLDLVDEKKPAFAGFIFSAFAIPSGGRSRPSGLQAFLETTSGV
jgi:hypothetical protein